MLLLADCVSVLIRVWVQRRPGIAGAAPRSLASGLATSSEGQASRCPPVPERRITPALQDVRPAARVLPRTTIGRRSIFSHYVELYIMAVRVGLSVNWLHLDPRSWAQKTQVDVMPHCARFRAISTPGLRPAARLFRPCAWIDLSILWTSYSPMMSA